jgi:hypothetical protein
MLSVYQIKSCYCYTIAVINLAAYSAPFLCRHNRYYLELKMKVVKILFGATILAIGTLPALAHKSTHHHHHYRPLEEKYFPIADELSLSRAVVETCYKSDGANLNKGYWDGQIAQIPHRELHSFNKRVDKGTTEIESSIPAGKEALWCDDRLDEFANKYKTTLNPSLGNGPATHPICWSDASGLYGCAGIGYEDALAGAKAIIQDPEEVFK